MSYIFFVQAFEESDGLFVFGVFFIQVSYPPNGIVLSSNLKRFFTCDYFSLSFGGQLTLALHRAIKYHLILQIACDVWFSEIQKKTF